MLCCLAALLVGSLPPDTIPIRPIRQLVNSSWSDREGAPSDLRALGQTRDGYLWVGTLSGLYRFDGVRFVRFVPQGSDTLPSGGVRNLQGAIDGSLWIVWRSGAVSHLSGGRLTSYGEQDGLPVTFRIVESANGTLLAGTGKGISRFEGTWKDAGQAWGYPGSQCEALWFDSKGTLWAETEKNVVYLPAGGNRFLEPDNPLKVVARFAQFAEARDGSIWMAELGRSVHTLRRMGDHGPINQVMVGSWTLLIDRKGSLWVGSAGDGLRRLLDPTRFKGQTVAQFGPEAEIFTRKDGLLPDVVVDLFEDQEGGVWVATERGLHRFREGPFAPIETPGGIRPRWVYATRDTSVWTTSYTMDFFSRIGPHKTDAFATGTQFLIVHQDPSGATWTVYGGQIYRLTGRRFVPIPLRPNPAHRLGDITVDLAGTIWVFDEEQGLLRVSHDSLIQVASIAQQVFPHGTLFRDRLGRIWVGQHSRIALYDHGKLSLFGLTEGVGQGVVSNFFEDEAGHIWASSEAGLSKFEAGRFHNFSGRNSVLGGSVLGATTDATGAWWVATPTGVYRFPPGEVERALADSEYSARYRSFDTHDGVPGRIVHPSWGPVLTRTPDGRVWVAGDSGVASVDPNSLALDPTPSVMIETARVGGREEPPATGLELPPGSRDLEIDYTVASFTAPQRIQFRYRLEGEDPEWRDVGARRRAYYSGLGPGRYTFRVMANNGDGVWRESETPWAFRVLPAWYQTWWFRSAMVLLIGVLGAVAASLFQRRRHQRAQLVLKGQYEATLGERARIAQDLHDTLLQGFAGVTLQLKAAELALPDKPKAAAETINRVRQLAQESLREARERVWEMRDTALTADDLPTALEAVARERCMGTVIEVALLVRGERRRLAREVEDCAFRVGREAIANAVRHAEPGRIEIEVTFDTATLGVEIRDDGRGFTPDQAEDAKRRGHFGLSGIRDRVTQARGRVDVSTRPGGGTVVSIELPLEKP